MGARSSRQTRPLPMRAISTYWDRTQWPLQSLWFLLPLLVFYEVGTLWYAPAGDARLPPILAESLLDHFFQWFGVTGYYLPGVLVIAVLVSWHVTRRDPWRIELPLYALMWLESLVLALPLFVFMLVLFREPAIHAWVSVHASTGALTLDGSAAGESLNSGVTHSWQAGLIFSIGAGIYEELLFRLIGIAVLHTVLVDVLALPETWGAIGAVVLSALAFALYHFTAGNVFMWGKFLFYMAAGVYLAAVYVLRGFGIVAATHALYDVLVVVLAINFQ